MKGRVLGGDVVPGRKMFQVLSARFPDTHCTIRGSQGESFYRSISLLCAGKVFEEVEMDTK